MYQISEAARQVGISIPTIRYYEKLGLIDEAPKNERGYKLYSQTAIQYLGFIVNLRETDMSLEKIKRYVDAYKAGDNAECYAILQAHALEVESELQKRQQILTKIHYKVSHFNKLKGDGK